MAFVTGQATIGVTGDMQTVTLGMKPTWVRITVGSRVDTTDPYAHTSTGACDSTMRQWCVTTCEGGMTRSAKDIIIDHVENQSGNIVTVLKARVDAFVTTGVRFKVIKGNTAYPVYIEAGN